MSDERQDGSKYQVALELARQIYRAEHYRPGSERPNPVPPLEAREYWLRLYDQCLELAKGNSIGTVLASAKAQAQK